MSNIKYYKSDIRVITLIYVFVATLIPMLAFSLTPGCSEEIEERDAILGPQVAEADVNQAIIKELLKNSIVTANVGSGVQYESSQTVESNKPYIYQKEARQVVDIEEGKSSTGTTVRTFHLEHKVYKYKEGEETEVIITEPTPITKEIASTSAHDSDIQAQQVIKDSVKSYLEKGDWVLRQQFKAKFQSYSMETLAEYKTTYHDLSVKLLKRPVPKLAAAQPNCNNIPQCTLDVVEVKYTIVLWEEGKPIDRLYSEIEFTSQVPFLYDYSDSKMILPALRYCQKFLAKTEDRDYIVNNCKILRNFIK